MYGDRSVFQRAMIVYVVTCLVCAAGWFAGTMQLPARYMPTAIPLGVALLMLALLWSHARCQRRSRRAEIVKSFAGLTVVHHGRAVRIADTPFAGEFGTRKQAVLAATRLGRWAVVVRAYDRYYLLAGRPTSAVVTPVALRTRAVADVVPADLVDDTLSA